MSSEQLKKALEKEKMVFGSERTIKKLKRGNVKKVFLASNCKKEIKEKIEHYAKLINVEVISLKMNNEELGVFCKKPFFIGVLCY